MLLITHPLAPLSHTFHCRSPAVITFYATVPTDNGLLLRSCGPLPCSDEVTTAPLHTQMSPAFQPEHPPVVSGTWRASCIYDRSLSTLERKKKHSLLQLLEGKTGFEPAISCRASRCASKSTSHPDRLPFFRGRHLQNPFGDNGACTTFSCKLPSFLLFFKNRDFLYTSTPNA